MLGWLAIIFAGFTQATYSQANTAELDLHITQADYQAVEGRGFRPPPYSLSEPGALPTGEWQRVALPHVDPLRLLPGHGNIGPPYTLVAWYRFDVPAQPAAEPGAPPRYLYIPRWKTDGHLAVYGDDRLLYQTHANLLWNGSNYPRWIALNDTSNAVMPRRITVRIERLRHTGAALSSMRIGDEATIGWRYRMRTLLQNELVAMSSAAFLAVGLFALVVWLRGRGGELYFLFFAMSVVWFARSLHSYVGLQRLPIPDEWFGWMTVSSSFWFIAVYHFFLRVLHGQKRPLIDRIIIIYVITLSVLIMPPVADVFIAWLPSTGITQATSMSHLIYATLIAMVPTMVWANAVSVWRKRSTEGMVLLAWGLVGYAMATFDWLLQGNRIMLEGGYISPYNGVGVFIIFMIIMLRHYTGAIDGIREANVQLETKLKAREAELQASHEKLREVEQRELLANERQRLMQDMHDGLGSSLVGALRGVESGHLQAEQLTDVIKGCIDDLRLAIDSLEPMEADLLLLLATLRFRLEPRLSAAGITLSWQVKDVPKLNWLEPRNALHVLRILQEAITNILKHTRATQITVATDCIDNKISVTVTDNGGGFDVSAARGIAAKGLTNQERRAQSIGARVELKSSSAGTQFTLRLPLERRTIARN